MECTVCNLICCYRNIQRGLKSEGRACIMGEIIVGHATGEEVAAINKAGVLFFFILMVDGAYCNLLQFIEWCIFASGILYGVYL